MPAWQFWPQERTEKFLALTALGWSAGLIAAELGLTRNAVIGKWHRSGIRHNQTPAEAEHVCKQRRSYKRRRPTTKVRPPPKFEFVVPRLRVVEPASPVSLNPKRLLELEPGNCRFPISPHFSRDYLFCGNPALGTYCPGHHWIAHDHAPSRKPQRFSLAPLWSANAQA
jgi:GcrA cell cycle regulator